MDWLTNSRRLQDINDELNNLRAAVNHGTLPSRSSEGPIEWGHDPTCIPPSSETRNTECSRWLNLTDTQDEISQSLESITVAKETILELLEQ
jgi:hypothetical protein